MAFALTTTDWRPVIVVAPSGTNLVLTWPGGGSLQSATNVIGPWINVPGATSPYVVPTIGPSGFYRVLLP
jgi:hypothetical protein